MLKARAGIVVDEAWVHIPLQVIWEQLLTLVELLLGLVLAQVGNLGEEGKEILAKRNNFVPELALQIEMRPMCGCGLTSWTLLCGALWAWACCCMLEN